ncbi:DNA double-strand break repair Rad50 ATPase, putative [Entamoeba dispar SAW760]|uniref:DNA double-strand break repair Rad50 ATPase, putative n=1 Tax=Entamoeba dispar (strain ATCC PRA-260 / SAW760) TaxID=370354 RepID=B0E7F9_ENTDS|nr:DNA double-strand break repair Rad50 ATPase, putative [Entamoeba dispar SAW760]EDR29530.1 DNA double-strand break repair Rad50 ATPase, putative [Entamoeba dispar SAW760]|eukprot:EDR29530.1 DNA double-strand break repair Rad50 ATPase, putative [Entamoeba dispar SAW760]
MTTFDKLEIAGIRSINPDKPVEIEFFKPLTLITGPNGAGKTTIIESVRYACTGTSPPNSNGGRLFVRDPTMSATKKTDAYINLSLDTSKGKLIISRKLGVSINLGKPKFSAKEAKLELDGQRHEINDGTLTSTIETSEVMLDSKGSKKPELRLVKFSEDYNKLKRDQNEIQKSQFDVDEKKTIKSQKLQEKELKIKEIELLNSQLFELQKESRRKENYMVQLKRYKDELQKFNRTPSNTREQLDILIKSLNQEIEKLETQSVDIQQKVNKEIKHHELSKQIQNQMKGQTLLENDLKNRKELEKEINEKIQGIESVEEKVNNEKIKIEEKQKGIEEEKKKEEKELEAMKKEFNEIKNELENRGYNIHLKQDDVKNKNKENEKKKKRNQEIQEEINEMKKDIIKKNEEIDELKKQLSKESFDQKEQKSKIKLEEIKKDIEEIDNEINRALENLQQQMKIERLMKEINENEKELENFKLTVGNDLHGKEKDIEKTIKKQKNEIFEYEK